MHEIIPEFHSAESIYDEYAGFYDECVAAGRNDLALYLSHVQEGGVVLDIGVGTGRVSAAFLEHRHQVIGVDISQGMLAVCAKKLGRDVLSGNLRLIKHDFCDKPLDVRGVGLAILSWFSFNYVVAQHLQHSMLKNIRMSLEPGATIILDLFCPKALLQGKTLWEEQEVSINESIQLKRIDRRELREDVEVRTQTYTKGEEKFRFVSKRRYVSPAQASHLLTQAGFIVKWASFDMGKNRFLPGNTPVQLGSFVIVAQLPSKAYRGDQY